MSRQLNVFLCGEKVGVLFEDDLLQLTFQYGNDAMPLSVRLPVRAESYPHALAYPFFENLTPEGEAFDILTRDHVSGDKIFSFLKRFGGDCAGAVAFYETTPNNDDKNLRKISPAEIAKIIDRLPQDPLLTGIDTPPRLSLAGAQSKFAVHVSGEEYFRSEDKYPTTHIIKITNKRFPHLLNNELFCMKLAKNMLSNVPEVELIEGDIQSHSYLKITRYDREIKNGVVCRIHQEDFCQALGIVSSKKYQTGGGAKLKDCYEVINEFSENRLTDITLFIKWIIFNYLIGNTDAHAKNLSLLHSDSASGGGIASDGGIAFDGGDGIRLAPFYDLLSTEVYPERIVDHGMAMLINGKGKYSSLRPKDFIALFNNLGLNATNTMKTLKDGFAHIVPAAEELRDSLLANEIIPDASMYNAIIAMIKNRLAVLFG